MDDDEREAIRGYKKYQDTHLPAANRLYDLVAPNFDPENYETTDRISALRQYLDELQPYVAVLVRAAHLRHQHFLYFLQDREGEDDGHKNWRLGMNDIAADAQEKLEYWTRIHDNLLARAIQSYEARAHIVSRVDMMSRNVDRSSPEEKSDKKKAVPRPKVSKAEIDRRNQEYREFLLQKKLEEERLVEEEAERMRPVREAQAALDAKLALAAEEERLAEEQRELLRYREMEEEIACTRAKCVKLANVKLECRRCFARYCSNRCRKIDRSAHKINCKLPLTKEERDQVGIGRLNTTIAMRTNRMTTVAYDQQPTFMMVNDRLGKKKLIDHKDLGVSEAVFNDPEMRIVSVAGRDMLVKIPEDVFELCYAKMNGNIPAICCLDGHVEPTLNYDYVYQVFSIMVFQYGISAAEQIPEELINPDGYILFSFEDYIHFIRAAYDLAPMPLGYVPYPTPEALKLVRRIVRDNELGVAIGEGLAEDIRGCKDIVVKLEIAHPDPAEKINRKTGERNYSINRFYSLKDLLRSGEALVDSTSASDAASGTAIARPTEAEN